MAFTFKPAVHDGTALYELPRPVPVVRIQDTWDFEQFKVPLLDGTAAAGHSRNGIDISVEGQVGSQEGTLKLSEFDMLEELDRLRNALHVSGADGRYLFFLYYDDPSATYRHFKQCTTVRFNWDLSDRRLFTYSVLIHADDPVLYSTSPGA